MQLPGKWKSIAGMMLSAFLEGWLTVNLDTGSKRLKLEKSLSHHLPLYRFAKAVSIRLAKG